MARSLRAVQNRAMPLHLRPHTAAPWWSVAALLLACSGATASAPPGVSLCQRGHRQSPIDITQASRRALPALEFSYGPAPLVLAHDGHTLRVRLGARGGLKIGAVRYTLQQLHFHTPGGDRLAGEEFPMAAHLLHKSPTGQLLALVVLMRTGSENALLAQLLPYMPDKPGGDHAVQGVSVDASALLPSLHAYYRYQGSLTAPPCTEGVDWIVLKQPMEVSPRQLARYRQHFADNARPAQALNGRVILESP